MALRSWLRLLVLFVGLITLYGQSVAVEKVVGFFYSGAINRALAIQASLSIDKDEVAGWYRYDGQMEELDLFGRLNGQKTVTLDETSDGKQTGKYIGNFSLDHRQFTGVWQSPDGKRRLSCVLKAAAEYRALYATSGAGETARFVEERYPVFLHPTPLLAQVNERCRTMALQSFTQGEKDGVDAVPSEKNRTEIVYLGKTWVSLMSTHVTDFGGMHPFYAYSTKNYLLTGKKPVQLDWLWLLSRNQGGVDTASLLATVTKEARKLAKAAGDRQFEERVAITDLEFVLTPWGITVIYPRDIGVMGGYFIRLFFTNPRHTALLAPLKRKLGSLR